MSTADKTTILALNGGSSTIKFALYRPGDPPRPLFHGKIDRTGSGKPLLVITDRSSGQTERIPLEEESVLADSLAGWLETSGYLDQVAAVGHRVVFGFRYTVPQLATPELVNALKGMIEFDPSHLPGETGLIEAISRRRPRLPQVVCFDTAFHRTIPPVAKTLPIPKRYREAGVERYGFHGLSYEYLLEEIERRHGREAAQGRIVMAHLGNGSSLAAVRDGKSVDTSMGFTPSAGLPMSTRAGDIDPGVAFYLLHHDHLTPQQFDDLMNRECGLLAISGSSADVRDLLEHQASDPRAREAIDFFCYQTRKWIGAYAAALGGIDRLVFAGGIGENAPVIRSGICSGLGFLGIELDEAANRVNGAKISAASARVEVEVIRTDEELMIAELTMRVAGLSAPERTGS